MSDKNNTALQSGARAPISAKDLAHITATCESLEINLPDSVTELQDWLVDAENAIARAMAKQGFGFIALKGQMEHGAWIDWLENNNFDERRVREQMSVAQMLLAAPESARPKLYGINSKKKLIALASLPAETIEDIAQSGELNELDQLSVREMKQRIRELQAEKADAAKQAETLQLQLESVRKKNVSTEAQFPLFYTEARQESAAVSEAAILNIDSLQRLIDETEAALMNTARLSTTDSGAENFTLLAAKSLVLHVRAVAARANDLLRNVAQWECAQDIDLTAELLMTDAEAENFIHIRSMLIQQNRHEEIMREQARAMSQKRGRGRPLKESK